MNLIPVVLAALLFAALAGLWVARAVQTPVADAVAEFGPIEEA